MCGLASKKSFPRITSNASVSKGGERERDEKDVLDYCPRYFDEILQVLELKTQTKAASRARTGCGLNQ